MPDGTAADIQAFRDASSVGSWAVAKVGGLVKAGIVNGDNGSLHPTASITRAEIAQMLYNLGLQFCSDAAALPASGRVIYTGAAPLTADVLPEGWELLPLPGHFLDMVGFRTPDDVVYLADCLASRETLDKYGIAFLYDVNAYLATLERVKAMSAALFIPSHAAATEDIAPLAQYNIDRTNEAAERISALCTGVTFDELLSAVFAAVRGVCRLRAGHVPAPVCPHGQHGAVVSQLSHGRWAGRRPARRHPPDLAENIDKPLPPSPRAGGVFFSLLWPCGIGQ